MQFIIHVKWIWLYLYIFAVFVDDIPKQHDVCYHTRDNFRVVCVIQSASAYYLFPHRGMVTPWPSETTTWVHISSNP